MNKTQVTLTIPGQIVNVDNNKVTIEFPTVEGPILTQEAIRVFTHGLPPVEADVLIERIGYYAFTESLRANISMSTMTTIVTNGRALTPEAVRATKY